MTLWLLIILWLCLAIIVFRIDGALATGFRPRLITLLAAILILGSYFFQDWLRFSFIEYFRAGRGPLIGLAPDVLERLGLKGLSPLLRVILGTTGLKGWQLMLVPFYGMGTRLATIVPLAIAILSLCWLPWGTSQAGSRLCKVAGTLMLSTGLVALIALAVSLPDLDAMGVYGHTQVDWALLTTLLGPKLGLGPWLTLLGLTLLCIGGLVEIGDPGRREINTPQGDPWPS